MHPLLLTACHFPIWVSKDKVGCTEYRNTILKTRTTIVVRNAGCAHSRYTRKLSLIFLNQSINQQSISRTAHPPLKMVRQILSF